MPDLSALAGKLDRAAAALRRDGLRSVRLLDAKSVVLAALDDIDWEQHYGNPGRGIDELLGTKEMVNG